MSTALQIVNRALRRINIIEPGASVEGTELADAMDTLALMVSSWATKGVVINLVGTVPLWQPDTAYVCGNQVANNGGVYTVVSPGTSAPSGGPTGQGQSVTDDPNNYQGISDGTVTWSFTGTQGPIDPSLERGFTDLLAIELCPDYGVEPSAGLMQSAKNGWRSILAFYIQAPNADLDLAVKQVPSQRYFSTVPNA